MNSQWWEDQKEQLACYHVTQYYKNWRRRQWTQHQAADALLDVERKVIHWVGPDRGRELLP